MKRTLSFFAVILSLALLLGVFAMPAAAADTSGYAAEVARLVNGERAKAGLPALAADTALNAAAQLRAQEITVSFKHARPGGREWYTVLEDCDIPYRRAAENIAYGQKTPADVVNAWMNSPGHKDNILGDYTKIGVGVYEKNGVIYWSQLFTNNESGGSGGNASFFARIWNWITDAWNNLTECWKKLLR